MLRWYAVTMLLLRYYALNDVTLLQCYDIKMILRCYALTMFNTLLRCYDRVWASSMYETKRVFISLLSKHAIIPLQKRPLSHDLTVSFRSVYNAEPKAAVICSALFAENLGRRKFLRNRI